MPLWKRNSPMQELESSTPLQEYVHSTKPKIQDKVNVYRLTNFSGMASGGCSVSAPALRPPRIFFTLSALHPSAISTRCSRRSVKSTATNSTEANFLPEHARPPSEKGKNVPFAGLRIPYEDVVLESIAEPLDDERDNIGLGAKGCCSCAVEGERNEEPVGEGEPLANFFSDISTDLRRI